MAELTNHLAAFGSPPDRAPVAGNNSTAITARGCRGDHTAGETCSKALIARSIAHQDRAYPVAKRSESSEDIALREARAEGMSFDACLRAITGHDRRTGEDQDNTEHPQRREELAQNAMASTSDTIRLNCSTGPARLVPIAASER